MDRTLAEKMATSLVGGHVGGWLLRSALGSGKSAVVFHASKDGKEAALKIIDPEIVERYGRATQMERIERERSLIGKKHPSLIEILDGGEDGKFLYTVMEYFDGPNLASVLADVPTALVRPLIAQVASAAQFLEQESLAHRDIKPENVALSRDYSQVKLLDLGVIRPLDLSSITDVGEQRLFVATLQYSPPELLFREEEPTIQGWRAITFYQLGGVLHDLLTRTQLFADYKEPYARLVRAVERTVPTIDGGADPDLRLLAQNCLAKSPRHRLDTVKWEDFSRPVTPDPIDAARRRIAQRRAVANVPATTLGRGGDLLQTQLYALTAALEAAARGTCQTEGLPRYSMKSSRPHSDSRLFRITFAPSAQAGLATYLSIYLKGRVVDADAQYCAVDAWVCLARTEADLLVEPLGEPAASQNGPLIDQDIRSFVQQCMLLGFALALDSSNDHGDPLRWLSIGARQ